MLKASCIVVLAFLLPAAVFCQTSEAPCSEGVFNAALQFAAISRTGVGTPYSLTATIKTEWKLADGNTISGFMTSRQARDGAGRTRVDEPTSCALDKALVPHWEGSITVDDPVGKSYTLWQESFRSPRKTATVTRSAAVRFPDPPTAQQDFQQAQTLSKSPDFGDPAAAKRTMRFAVEDLGKRDVAGLEASGMRITRTVPTGLFGNSLPLVTVEEKWVSDAYRVVLLDIKDDPMSGKSTYEVTNFTRGEPDASEFQPPAGYTITERNLNE